MRSRGDYRAEDRRPRVRAHQIRHRGRRRRRRQRRRPRRRVDIANTPPASTWRPDVPGTGLYLDEISWFDISARRVRGARAGPRARREEAFKLREIYPHPSHLHRGGTYTTIVRDLRAGGRRRREIRSCPSAGTGPRLCACGAERVLAGRGEGAAERRREARRRRREGLTRLTRQRAARRASRAAAVGARRYDGRPL